MTRRILNGDMLEALANGQGDFTESFDARPWAREFVKSVRERPEIATDEDTMIGWFANAIMRGYDESPGRDLNHYSAICHEAALKWWHDPATGARLERNKGEMLMLMVSEIAEAMEGERKDLMDDKLPHRKMVEVELADALIRIFDYAGAYGFDLEGAVREKMAYNAQREDHKAEARLAAGGKKW